ncbi:MAG: RNase H family protein [Polyangiales bacterium]
MTHARESQKRPVAYRSSRAIDASATWMFTDGSGSGWHGLVVLRPGRPPRLVARETRMAMRNVGAEMNGLLLALEAVDAREPVTVVSDYLWSIYYVLDWRVARHPALVEQVREARAALSAKAPARLGFVHVRGHRRDGTDFGFWNDIADKLCGARVAFDGELPESVLREHVASGRGLGELLRRAIDPSRETAGCGTDVERHEQ